jgi:hypothetical protein
MKKEQVARLVEHWRRPIPANDLFRFSRILVNSKTDSTMPALYQDSLGPHTVAQPGQAVIELGGSTEMGPIESGAATLDWDAEYRAANVVEFSSGTDDINMHGDVEPGLDLQLEQVIDPALIGLTHTGQQISPTVQMKKQPTKAKGRPGKQKPKIMRQSGANTPSEVEPAEPTATVDKPRPKPRPLNPHLMPNNFEYSAPADELSETGEILAAQPKPTSTVIPVQYASAQPNLDVPTACTDQPTPFQCEPDQSGLAGELLPASLQPRSLSAVQPPAEVTPAAMHSVQPSLAVVQSEPDASGRPRRQPPKRKLDPYLTWEIKDAEQKAEQERAKLKQKGVEGPTKRQRTK